MNELHDKVVQAFRRVIGWFAANPQVLADGPAGAPALARQVEDLKGVVSRATQHVTEQQTQDAQTLLISKDERERRKEILSHHMATIAQMARALIGQVPGIGVLSIPKGHLSTPALIEAATAMARKAEIYASALIQNGLPQDFVKQLDDAAAALKASFDARGQSRAARAGAVRGRESEIAIGRTVVATMDAVLKRSLRSQPAKFAEWKQLKRIVKKPVALRAPGGLSQPVQPSSGDIHPATSAVQPSTDPVKKAS